MSRISRVENCGKSFRVEPFSVLTLALTISCVFQSLFSTSAFANEFTIYSSEGIQKIKIMESADSQKTRDNYRLVGEKCILNCEASSQSQSTDKKTANEAWGRAEKKGQYVTVNIFPDQPYPYTYAPYGWPSRVYRFPNHPKPHLHLSVNSRHVWNRH